MTNTETKVTRFTDNEACEIIRRFLESADVDGLADMVSRFCEDGPTIVYNHKGDSDVFEDGEIIQIGYPVILARTYDDGHVVEVLFDAEPWFKQASDEEIRELAACRWGGDDASDNIAFFMADRNVEVANMFKQRDRSKCGFECYVDVEDAMKWLNTHRPHLSDQFLGDEDTLTDGTLKGR